MISRFGKYHFDHMGRFWVQTRGDLRWNYTMMDPGRYLALRAHEFWGHEICSCFECRKLNILIALIAQQYSPAPPPPEKRTIVLTMREEVK